MDSLVAPFTGNLRVRLRSCFYLWIQLIEITLYLLPCLDQFVQSVLRLTRPRRNRNFFHSWSLSLPLPSFGLCLGPAYFTRLARQLPLNAQQIVNGVQNGVLPLDVILQPEHALRFAGVQRSDRPKVASHRRINDWQTFLQLRPLLREQFDRLCPCKRARRHDEPFQRPGRRRGKLEREYVRARHVPHVDVHRRPARRAIVPADGTTGRTGDQRVYVPIRARRRRIVDLAGAEGTESVRGVDGRDVEVRVSPLEIAHRLVGETLGDRVYHEAGRAWLERVFPRQGAVCCVTGQPLPLTLFSSWCTHTVR
jgi:hypothetical protein